MAAFVVLLRGINVSGRNKIPMAALRELMAGLGFPDAVTYLQSGNVVLRGEERSAADLEAAIETAITSELGLDVLAIARTADDLAAVARHNPFSADSDAKTLHVTFLKSSAPPEATAALVAPAGLTDEYRLGDSEVYLHCPDGYGRTKLNNAFWERKLRTPATTRNWNTVNALLDLSSPR